MSRSDVSPNRTCPESNHAEDIVRSHAPTSKIYRWTFRKEATAACFIRDVFSLQQEEDSGGEFFWLGMIPCRSVRIVGMVIGVVQYEDNIRYSVDDGSGIIDCLLKHDKPPLPSSPKKRQNVENPPSSSEKTTESRPPPIADVGTVVKVEGRVSRARGSRILRVERGGMTICRTSDDEPKHWMEVIRLHKESYNVKRLFIIPSSEEPTTPQRASSLRTSPGETALASSPPQASSCPGSPVKQSTKNSKSESVSPSPARLRHPSKLRTRDLTDATFRIYVKHYLDNALELRYSSSLLTQGGITSSQENVRQAFTISYLRRVPMLADMARSVVRAERKRRERETRKQQESQTRRPTPRSSNQPSKVSSESASRKTKRLFIQTIRALYAEGSIVIWDGPRLTHQTKGEASQHSYLWKDNTNTTTLSNGSTQNTSLTNNHSQGGDESPVELSDENPDEEAYIPLSPIFAAELVMDAMRQLSARFRASTEGPSREARLTSLSPTAADIISYLRRKDDRWANLGEWTIEGALELLESEDFIFKAGKGRWALCL